jgi:putative transposase
MYDYRRMTREERIATVEHRRTRGFPLHKPPHFVQERGWYLVTAATYEHRPHFGAPNELRALELRLLEALAEYEVPCAGWVVLPNHYHALIETGDLTRVGTALGTVHGRSARYANKRDNTPGRQVWYNFTDRRMRSGHHFWASLHYIAYNPVKHGYVDEFDAWPWSCVHELRAGHGSDWVRDLIEGYPLGGYGDGWDL